MPVSTISQNIPPWDTLFLGTITVDMEQYTDFMSLHCSSRIELQTHAA